MQKPPFEVSKELQGWLLFWARLEAGEGGEEELASLRSQVVVRARARLALETLSGHPPVAALRRLFKAAGCDPTRYRPSSEALLRRILKGEEIPMLHPLVDLNNCLSAELAVPCCVMREGTFAPPCLLRAGREGENYESLRGPFNLAGKPLLVDTAGPLDTPITGNERVKITPGTTKAWLVAYLPDQVVDPGLAQETFLHLIAAVPALRASLISLT